MNHIRTLALAFELSSLLSLSACGGGSSSDSSGSGMLDLLSGFENSGYDCAGGGGLNLTPGGIWMANGVLAIVDEAGAFRLVRQDGSQYVGTLAVLGDTVTAAFTAFPKLGSTFPDGSTSASGNLEGTFVPGSSLVINDQLTTANGTISSDTFAMDFDFLYNCGSSLSNLSHYNSSVSVSTSGTISGQDPGAILGLDPLTGCEVTGTLSVINQGYNVLGVSFPASNCPGRSSAFDGVQFSGLAYFHPPFEDYLSGFSGPAVLHGAVEAQVDGVSYGETF